MMNIGIIIYSQTGNTNTVAEKIGKKLLESGHSVFVEKVVPTVDVHPGIKNVEFRSLPDLNKYDALIFGAPVQAFHLCAAMSSYLDRLSSLSGKKVFCFVTKALPYNWTGGNRAINSMRKACESKGAQVVGTGVVYWGEKVRENSVSGLVEQVAGLF